MKKTIKIYVLKDEKSSGDVYLRGYNPYTKDDEWTGVVDRAMIFFHQDVAENQASNLAMKGMDCWEVVQVEVEV